LVTLLPGPDVGATGTAGGGALVVPLHGVEAGPGFDGELW